ncbi:MAG: SRPBCC family protein [Pseudomonadota bacterium]
MAKIVTIEKSIVINAPIDEVWRVSATDFVHIDQWDGNVKSSSSSGQGNGESPSAGRVCNMYNGGMTVEKLVEFDAEKHSFKYDIVEGLPGFVVHARNSWIHQPMKNGKTRLTMKLAMQVKGILGTLMRIPMKSQMGKVLGKAQEELKHYVEFGKPHPRKQKKARSAV